MKEHIDFELSCIITSTPQCHPYYNMSNELIDKQLHVKKTNKKKKTTKHWILATIWGVLFFYLLKFTFKKKKKKRYFSVN